MKKLYFLFLIISLTGYSQNITITKVIETGCSDPFVKTVELYVDGTVDFSTEVTLNYMNNGSAWSPDIDVSGFGVISNQFIYIIRDLALMQAEFPSTTFEIDSGQSGFNTIVTSTATNGDDGYQVVLNGIVVSQFGETLTDGTGQVWEHVDAVASRKSGIPDTGSWNSSHWDFTALNALDTETACQGGLGLEAYFNTLGGTFPLGSGSGWTPACGTLIGESTAICDTKSSGATDDTYSATLDFSGGNNGNIFIVNSNAGIVGGDNPTSSEMGTITITNIPEGTDITVTISDTADGGLCSLSRDIESPGCVPLIINEVLFDPATDITGDANGDGTRDALQDEFIELYNTSNSPLDISGYTISDGSALRHTFPASTIIPGNRFLVIFGGGSPTGSFGGSTIQIASEGELNLNNAGDEITIRNTTNNIVLEYKSVLTGVSHASDVSVTKSPDFTGDFVLHTDANASILFSPGLKVDGTTLSTTSLSRTELSIHPNPANKGYVNIKSQISGDKTVKLYDIMGRQVLTTILKTDILDVNSIQRGLYLLNVSIDNRSSTIKLMID